MPPLRVFPQSAWSLEPLRVPPGKRVPFGWQAAGLETGAFRGGNPLHLEFAAGSAGRHGGRRSRLRFTVALDVRETKQAGVCVPSAGRPSGRCVSTVDAPYAHYLQLYECVLEPEFTERVLRDGAALRQMIGDAPLFVFTETGPGAAGLQPYLLIEEARECPPGEKVTAMLERTLSLESLQPLGWMEGCVLDGLLDLSAVLGPERARPALDAHLGMYFDRRNLVVYENHLSEPADGAIYGIEGTLPYAALALTDPAHPALDLAVEFWRRRVRALDGGLILDGSHVTTEGVYTVAYPLAVLAHRRGGNQEMESMAVRQILLRRNRLATEGGIFQRTRGDGLVDDQFRNWARGVAWYLLGMTRALPFLSHIQAADEIGAALRHGCERAMRLQRPDGLWSCFLHEPDTSVETSGSAGIAAALARADALGFGPPGAREAAARAMHALVPYLTPDGFLTGTSQTNKGGPALQRGGVRGISQYALGLACQLWAALPESDRPG